MYVVVEPRDGTEVERLITALLNATGVVYRTIEAADEDDGLALIDAVAKRLRAHLAPLGEHYSDDDLAEVTGTLAHIALLVGDELGLGDVFEADWEGPNS